MMSKDGIWIKLAQRYAERVRNAKDKVLKTPIIRRGENQPPFVTEKVQDVQMQSKQSPRIFEPRRQQTTNPNVYDDPNWRRCLSCGKKVSITNRSPRCPYCGGQLTITSSEQRLNEQSMRKAQTGGGAFAFDSESGVCDVCHQSPCICHKKKEGNSSDIAL